MLIKIVLCKLCKPLIHKDFEKGAIVCPLDRGQARQAINRLAEKGVESIAVCLLWAFKNSMHEKELKKIIPEEYPGIYTLGALPLLL